MADIDFTITHDTVKSEMLKVWDMVNKGLKGGTVLLTLGREKNTRPQEKCQHAMIGDIVKQANRSGATSTLDQWKDLLVSGFAREKQLMGEPLKQGNSFSPSLCGTYMVSHRPSTKTFDKKIGSEYIEYIYVMGGEYGVEFTDKTLAEYETYREANG
jgi:hypothetical protein